jgi:hypothetical protein
VPRPSDLAYWQSVHNSHVGERCFILAPGPSLRHMDVSRLASEFTIGMDFLYKWDGLRFIPNAWVCAENDVLKEVAPAIAHWDIPKVIGSMIWPYWDTSWRWLYKDPRGSYSKEHPPITGQDDLLGLGDDFWRCPPCYSPVPDVAIPLALWLGFSSIYMLGVDHDSTTGYCYDIAEYRQDVSWRNTNQALARIQSIIESYGRTLYNCSPGSKAPVSQISLDDALKS